MATTAADYHYARLLRYYKRQLVPRWGPRYMPATRATVAEAPDKSKAKDTWADTVGRRVHTFSTPEESALWLALYQRRTVDVQEQRVLWPESTPHPLHGSPYDCPRRLPALPGILAVAEELGYVNLLSRVSFPNPDSPSERLQAVMPLVGDLLLYQREDNGQHYCINWNIKANSDGFKKPVIASLRKRTDRRAAHDEVARHLMESRYYSAAGIRTVEVAAEEIPKHLACNLAWLITNQPRRTDYLSTDGIRDLRSRLLEGCVLEIPPSETFGVIVARHRIRPDLCGRVLCQMIWRRELPADLYSPILEDSPLRPPYRDPLVHFSEWFQK